MPEIHINEHSKVAVQITENDRRHHLPRIDRNHFLFEGKYHVVMVHTQDRASRRYVSDNAQTIYENMRRCEESFKVRADEFFKKKVMDGLAPIVALGAMGVALPDYEITKMIHNYPHPAALVDGSYWDMALLDGGNLYITD